MYCDEQVMPGFKTYTDASHRACEDYYALMGKAMFQLKSHLEQNHVSQTDSAIPVDKTDCSGSDRAAIRAEDALQEEFLQNEGDGLHDEEIEVTDDGGINTTVPDVCPSKSEMGNRKIRARFGHKRTHNEELCVASCGVILGRATFYGSEGPCEVCVRDPSFFAHC